ncbi:MAG TPA: glyoxalase [Dysgonomonas sp.]|nr:glyoxalase [Dysgonomonas sp.]
MKRLVAFFEIPCVDFERAVDFYGAVLGVELTVMDCESEKMAFFPDEEGVCPGAISWAEGFKPCPGGTLLSLNCDDMQSAISKIEEKGGKIIIEKTKIEADNRGYFCVFQDCEGNRLGLYSDN